MYDGESHQLQNRVGGSRRGIGLPRRQSLLFYRGSEKPLMCLIDMFFYRPVSFMGLYAFYDVLRLYCEFS